MDVKPLLLLSEAVKSPPFSRDCRKRVGFLLRLLQRGEILRMPESRALPTLGSRVHELRVFDSESRTAWRIVYRIDTDVIVIVDIFTKKTQKTPKDVLWRCRARLKRYDLDRKII